MVIEVTDEGASLEFVCANGAINEPLTLNADGQFDVAGVYVREGPGPVRMDEDNRQAARYRGKVDGQVLTLTIKLGKSDETLGPFSYTFGKSARVFKCM